MNAIDQLQFALENIRSGIKMEISDLARVQSEVDTGTQKLAGLRADEKSIIAALDVLQGATQDVEASLAVARQSQEVK